MSRYELQITTDRGMVQAAIIDTESNDRIVEDLPIVSEDDFVLHSVISDCLVKKQEWNNR